MSIELATVPVSLLTEGAIVSSPIFDYSSPSTKIELWNSRYRQFEGEVINTAVDESIKIIGLAPSPLLAS